MSTMFDINEELPSTYGGGNIINMLWRDGIEFRFPKKDGQITLLVMPAFGPGNAGYVPYRQLQGGNYIWSRWATQFRSYQLIGGRLNLIDPIMFGDGAVDPVKALLDVANTTPEFYHLVNKGADGKRLAGDQPPPSLSTPGVKFALNCVELNPRKPEDVGLSRVHILNETAIKPRARKNDKGAGSWGLIAELNRRQRNIEGVDPGDFSHYYYWGDITDPNGLVPCLVGKSSPATGGMPIWKMEPTDSVPPVQGTQAMLDSRVDLTQLFEEPDPKEIVDALVDIYGANYPSLIRRAFESQWPGVANMLQQTGVVSHSRVHMSAATAEAIVAQPAAAPRAPFVPLGAQPAATFAPAAAAQPAAAPQATVIPARTPVPAFQPAAAAPAATPAVPVAPPVPTVTVPPQAAALSAEQIRAELTGGLN